MKLNTYKYKMWC